MKDIPTSPRIIEIRHNRRVRRLRFIIIYLIIFILFVAAFSVFSGEKHLVIDKVVINGNHIIDQAEIEKDVYNQLLGKYFYLFYKSNSFIYPRKQIYNNLLLDFPRIEKLAIYRDNLKTLHIDIIERTGSFLYCGVNLPEEKLNIGENCYFLNNDGFIFDKAPYFSGNVYFKYYSELEGGITNPLGKQMLNTEKFHKLARFIDNVASLGFKPIYIISDLEGTNSLYLNYSENSTIPKIIFKNDADLDVILDNFSLAMQKSEFANEINSKYNTLLYIDLRFNNKVLYKFQ